MQTLNSCSGKVVERAIEYGAPAGVVASTRRASWLSARRPAHCAVVVLGGTWRYVLTTCTAAPAVVPANVTVSVCRPAVGVPNVTASLMSAAAGAAVTSAASRTAGVRTKRTAADRITGAAGVTGEDS